MTKNELNILRKERVQQLLNALNQKTAIARSVCKHFGEDGKMAVREGLEEDLQNWISSVKNEYAKENRNLDIQGIHDFLWEPNRDEQIEFKFSDSPSGREYTVSNCPLAEYSIHNNIAEWGYFFFCGTYPFITNTYNPNITFNMTHCLMKGDTCCKFSYSQK